MPTRIQDTTPAVDAMASHWPVVDALLGGTVAMRAAGERYLPIETREDPADYKRRLAVATLFPAFRRTLGVMAGKPFSKALTYGQDVPDIIREYCQDVDLQGRNLHTYASELLPEVLAYGIAGVLVDFPKTGGENRTLDDDRRLGARPYFVSVKHGQILGWRAERLQGGAMALTQLRLSEAAEVEDGPYGAKQVERIRVLTPDTWELWEKAGNDFTLIDEGVNSLGRVPFVPFFGQRTGFMEGKSPLLDLAHLNVKHWQHQSDQDDSARFARKRMLVFSGMDNNDAITSAANYAVCLPTGATAQVVQGSAESVNVGRTELEALEAQMIQTGAELLVQKPGQRSATEANNDAEANKSDLQRIVEGFEDGLDESLQLMADWLGLGVDAGHVSLYKDYGAGSLSDASAQLVLSMHQGGLITASTAIREQQRRGLISSELNPEDELEAVKEEGPPLGLMGNA